MGQVSYSCGRASSPTRRRWRAIWPGTAHLPTVRFAACGVRLGKPVVLVPNTHHPVRAHPR
jgi:hypothetical protein